jgi:phosphoribosylanthranilate isomerase
MTWVKICGTTNLEDALLAVDADADAVGFVFYERSPRNIGVATAQAIVEKLPANVEKVGVFVDAGIESIRETVSGAGLTIVQLHGEHSMRSAWLQDSSPADRFGVSKVIPMIAGDALKDGGIFMGDRFRERTYAILIDNPANGASGGTGSTFDWAATRGMVQALSLRVPVIVAGGLTHLNVNQALHTFQPFGVDVASGVEARPGKKDPDKVQAFVRAVREFDRKTS